MNFGVVINQIKFITKKYKTNNFILNHIVIYNDSFIFYLNLELKIN